jgi:hypothetical protein
MKNIIKINKFFLMTFFLVFFNCCEKKYDEYLVYPNINLKNCNSKIKIVEFAIVLDKKESFFLIVYETNNKYNFLNKNFTLLFYNKKVNLYNTESYYNLKGLKKVRFHLNFLNFEEENFLLKGFSKLIIKEQICNHAKEIIENINISCNGEMVCFSEQIEFFVLDKR